MTPDQWLRLFVLVVYATTCLCCLVRAWFTREIRARVGNVAFGATCGVAWYGQTALWNVPATLTTWLLAGAACVCIAYLAVLARKGS